MSKLTPAQAIEYIYSKYGYRDAIQVIHADASGAIFAPSYDPRRIAPDHTELDFLQGVYKRLVTEGKE